MTERDGQGGDPVGDFQRWLMRSGARGLGRELTGQVRRAFGQGGAGRGTGDVWEEATRTDPGEPPECAWCPVCRAARTFRKSGPGLGAHLAGAGDAFAAAVQQAFAAFEAAMQADAKREPAEPAGPATEHKPH